MKTLHDQRSPRHALGDFGHGPALVPPCRCAGTCRCGGLVPALLMQQLEHECEFYRQEL
jgi:hypothetical protein